MNTPLPTTLRQEHGTAVVEMALVLAFILVPLMMGFLNFALVLGHWQEAEHKASTGARYASVGRSGDGGPLTTYIKGTAPVTASVCASQGMEVGKPVTVKVTRTDPLFPILGLGPSITLEGKAEMRIERLPIPGDPQVYGGTC